jgi:ribose 5-phosphate isomerase A
MEKKIACEVAIRYMKDGMNIGFGTGSTVNVLLDTIDEMNLTFKKSTFVSTSDRTTEKALKLGLNVNQEFKGELDVSIDGADEIDPNGNLIKGGGGALTREKIVASNSRNLIIIADSGKYVDTLGRYSLPVEIFKLFSAGTIKKIESMGSECRMRDNGAFTTENGNFIVDCKFHTIRDPVKMENAIKMIPGVVEVGLFVGMANLSIEGRSDGAVIHRYRELNGL